MLNEGFSDKLPTKAPDDTDETADSGCQPDKVDVGAGGGPGKDEQDEAVKGYEKDAEEDVGLGPELPERHLGLHAQWNQAWHYGHGSCGWTLSEVLALRQQGS